jgi:hypothetical protein
MIDIDRARERQAVQATRDSGVVRRRIEILREAQLLQQTLADSYDECIGRTR